MAFKLISQVHCSEGLQDLCVFHNEHEVMPEMYTFLGLLDACVEASNFAGTATASQVRGMVHAILRSTLMIGSKENHNI